MLKPGFVFSLTGDVPPVADPMPCIEVHGLSPPKTLGPNPRYFT